MDVCPRTLQVSFCLPYCCPVCLLVCLFVCVCDSANQVIPWRERPLSPEDIARYTHFQFQFILFTVLLLLLLFVFRVKLVGLCQNRSGKPLALPPHMKVALFTHYIIITSLVLSQNYVSFWDCSPGAARVWTPPYEVAPCLRSRLLLFTMLFTML